MSDLTDWVGAEHFPTCHCFATSGGEYAEALYALAQDSADQIIARAVETGFCIETYPFIIAMVTDMCISIVGSMMTTERHPGATKEGNVFFAETQRTLHETVRTRLDALMRRGQVILTQAAEGTSSVQ